LIPCGKKLKRRFETENPVPGCFFNSNFAKRCSHSFRLLTLKHLQTDIRTSASNNEARDPWVSDSLADGPIVKGVLWETVNIALNESFQCLGPD